MVTEINQTINFVTDTATFAVFDPECLKARLDEPCDWWCGSFAEIKEIMEGKAAFVSTTADGVFKVRITSGDLTPEERDYCTERIGPLGFEVKSGKVFVGQGERITGGGFAPEEATLSNAEGSFVEIPPGAYDIHVYSIVWFDSPLWWRPDGQRPETAPADLVVTIEERSEEFKAPTQELRLCGLGDSFLFESNTRQIGPIAGLTFATEVWKNPSGLTLKAGGPRSYKPILKDFTGLAWRDKVLVRVLTVDHQTQTTEVELAMKLPS